MHLFKYLLSCICSDTHKNPIKCYYAKPDEGRNCRVILQTPCLPADNPQQSEEASHIGGNANPPCRKCKIGGTGKEKESDEIYEQFYSVRQYFFDCDAGLIPPQPGEPQNTHKIR